MDELLVHVGLVDQVTKPLQSISKEVKSTLAIAHQSMASITAGDKGLSLLGLLSGTLKELKSSAIALSNNDKEGVKAFDAIKDTKFTQETLDSTDIATEILTPWQQFQTELIAVRDSISNGVPDSISSVVDPLAELMNKGLEDIVSWTKEIPLLGDSISSVVDPLADLMSKGLEDIVSWTKEVPLLGDALHYAAVAGSSGGAVFDGLVSAIDLAEEASENWTSAMEGMSEVSEWFRNQTALTTAATWLFNSALWANPVTWIVAGVIALGAAVVGIIYYWDDLSAAMTNAVNSIMGYWDKFVSKLNEIWILRKIGELFSWIGSQVMQMVDMQIKAWTPLFDFISSIFSSIGNIVTSVMNDLVFAWELFSSALVNTAFVQSIIEAFNTVSSFVSTVFDRLVSTATRVWALIGIGVDLFLFSFKSGSNIINAFFTLLIDGPEAALVALGNLSDIFTNVMVTVQNGWQLMKDGFMGFFEALSDLSVFDLIGDSIDWLLDKLSFFGIDVEADVQSPAELDAAKKSVEITETLKSVPQLSSISTQADYVSMKAANQQQNSAIVTPLKSNLMSYKQPHNQTQLPTSMVQNATTVNKQQQGASRTYGNIVINAHEPFTPDALAQWEELNAG